MSKYMKIVILAALVMSSGLTGCDIAENLNDLPFARTVRAESQAYIADVRSGDILESNLADPAQIPADTLSGHPFIAALFNVDPESISFDYSSGERIQKDAVLKHGIKFELSYQDPTVIIAKISHYAFDHSVSYATAVSMAANSGRADGIMPRAKMHFTYVQDPKSPTGLRVASSSRTDWDEINRYIRVEEILQDAFKDRDVDGESAMCRDISLALDLAFDDADDHRRADAVMTKCAGKK